MRIRSSFKDYYDGVARNWQDASLLYVRDERTFDVPYDDYLRTGNGHISYNFEDFENWWVIGFCGKVWLYYCHYTNSWLFSSFDKEETIQYYRLNKADWFIRRRISEVYDKFEANKSRYMEYFYKFDCPAFLIRPKIGERKTILQTNPRLADVAGFIQKFPPYQAYQELQMWLANKASPEKPLPKIDDVTLASAKGFDKYSFRKDKQHGNIRN